MREGISITLDNFSIYCWGELYDTSGHYYDKVLIYSRASIPDSLMLRATTTPTAECPGGDCADAGIIPLHDVDAILLRDDRLHRQSKRPLRELLSEPNYDVPLSTFGAIFQRFKPFPWVSVEMFQLGVCDECGKRGWHVFSRSWSDVE